MGLPNEALLWRAVIKQAALDGLSARSNLGLKNQAIHWFYRGKTFETICELADRNPSYIRKKFFEALLAVELRRLNGNDGKPN